MMQLTLPKFQDAKVLVIGDVMLDRYWKGSSNRISPEAPVPVVKVSDREDRPGGAANVALNIAALGAPVNIIGITGDDEPAAQLQKSLHNSFIKTDFVISKDHPTITKLRVISRGQQLIRLDFEEGFQNIDQAPILAKVRERVSKAKVVVCSDYGKGALHSIERIIEIARNAKVPVLIDPKGTDFEKYRGATLLTPNMSEFEAVAGKVTSEEDLINKGKKLISDFGIEALLITRSENGMTLIRPGFDVVTLPTEAKEVYDVTGAGDTVIGTLAASLASGIPLLESCAIANKAAGVVVGKIGTSTVSPAELAKTITKQDYPSNGVISLDELLQAVRTAKLAHEKIVMTNGCFDILHSGHIQYLNEARALGDRLIVAVNTDASVSRLKGDSRPINTLQERMDILAGLKAVDWVVPFDTDTPRELIAQILPDILVKGGDYKAEEIAGYKEVTENGGEVIILSFKNGCSTTNVVKKILETAK
jgi:D-beta-D-heptose 7-phosphate kinase/D-beta-D-heptose 1-phosphate adenosyltransferase